MGTTTRETARREVSRLTGSYYLGSTTTDITASENIVDTSLENKFRQDDSCKNWFVWIDTTANSEIKRIVEGYTASSGTIACTGANFSAESGSVDYELHGFDPEAIHNAIEYAIDTQYDKIWQEVDDYTLFTRKNQLEFDLPSNIDEVFQIWIEEKLDPNFDENILYTEGVSADFEDWAESSYPDGATSPTNLTLSKYGLTSQQEEFVPHQYQDYIMKCVSSGTAGYVEWSISNPAYYGGQKLTFDVPFYCLTTSEYTVKIEDDSGNTESSAHGGTGMERLRVTHSVTDSPTSLKVSIQSAGNSVTGYACQLVLTRAERYATAKWRSGPDFNVFNDVIRFKSYPPEGKFLVVRGKSQLSQPTSDSSTMEIDEPKVKILYQAALVHLLEQKAGQYAGQAENPYENELNRQYRLLQLYRRQHGMKKPTITRTPVM